MQDSAARYKHMRGTRYNRRKKKNSKRDSKIADVLIRQAVLVVVLLLTISIIMNVDTPVTNRITGKIKEILSTDTNLKDTYDGVSSFIQKVINKDAGTFDGSSVPTNADVEIPEDYGGGNIDYSRYYEDVKGVSDVQEEETNIPVEDTDAHNEGIVPDTVVEEEENSENTAQDNSGGEGQEVSFLAPVQGKVGSPFGDRIHPIKKTADFHEGIDIEATTGVAIKAPLDGEVVEATKEATYGNYVKIKHEEGLVTFYAHCSILHVTKGQKVEQGDVIAEVGNTGNSLGPHLHFEVIKDGKHVNPLNYIDLPS